MNQQEWLATRFESERTHLRSVAYRMLGNLAEADDAVQEAWLHVSRSDTGNIENMGGWLTTIVARVCLDQLRARKSRDEESFDLTAHDSPADRAGGVDPEEEALLADSVGIALLVVLDTLSPAERLAFVLHDVFAVPFEDIAKVVDRSPIATRQLASRARRRVRQATDLPDQVITRQKEVVEAFLSASREGSFEALLEVLDPDVVFRADPVAAAAGSPSEVRGAAAVARQFLGRAHGARPVLVDGAVGLVVPWRGRPLLALRMGIQSGRIIEIQAVADPAHLRRLHLSVIDKVAGEPPQPSR